MRSGNDSLAKPARDKVDQEYHVRHQRQRVEAYSALSTRMMVSAGHGMKCGRQQRLFNGGLSARPGFPAHQSQKCNRITPRPYQALLQTLL